MLSHNRTALLGSLAAATLGVAACSGGSDLPTAPTTPAMVASASPPPESAPPPPPPSTARYRVVFDATWTGRTHPLEVPGNPHFSPLVGGTHSSSAGFWQGGFVATEGIRRMAERGDVSPLDDEIRSAIAAGTAERLLRGDGVSSPKTTSFEFDISSTHPLVTLVTMVAPSPDWFVGVSALPLYDQGTWATDVTVALTPWDAGTDSGTSFLSPDSETLPRQPISRITGAPLGSGSTVVPLGTLRFTKVQ